MLIPPGGFQPEILKPDAGVSDISGFVLPGVIPETVFIPEADMSGILPCATAVSAGDLNKRPTTIG